MRTLLLLAILASGLMLLGCTYSSNYTYNSSMNASTNTTPPPAVKENVTAPPAQGTNASSAPQENASEPAPAAAGDLSGKTYSDLLMSGSGSQCTASISADSRTMNLKLYFDGKGKLRVEEPDTGLKDCPSGAMVFKGDLATGGKLYGTCPGHEGFLGSDFNTHNPCAWMSMDVFAEYGGVGSSSLGFGTENETWSTPPIDMAKGYSCQPWNVDSSKFDVNGFVCD